MPWADHAWRRADLPAGLAALARMTGLVPAGAVASTPAGTGSGWDRAGGGEIGRVNLDDWLARCGLDLGVRMEAVSARYPRLRQMLRSMAPAVIRIEAGGREQFLLLTGSRGGTLRALGPDLAQHSIPCGDVIEALTSDTVAAIPTDIDACLNDAGIPPKRRARAREGIITACLQEMPVGRCWLLRPARTAGWARLLRRDGIGRKTLLFTVLQLAQSGLNLVAWMLVGSIAFSPTASTGWLLPLVLILSAMVLLQMGQAWVSGLAALAFGSRLKERLLTGALRLPIDEVRADGVGRHLGRVIESDVFEGALLAGAVMGAAALADLAAAMIAAGASGILQPWLIAAWSVPVTATAVIYLRSRRRWADARLRLTHGLIERMVGHQTRLAQEPADRRHDGEDAELAAYYAMGNAMDPWLTRLSLLATRGWLPVGLASLMPAFIWGGAGQVAFGVGLGAVLLAQRAFTQFAYSCTFLADAVIGWRIVGPLSEAAVAKPDPAGAALGRSASTTEDQPNGRLGSSDSAGHATQPLLEGHGLRFAYDGRPVAVLDGCDFVVRSGDRILLEGGSGSGKSTLAAVLAGLRPPAHGLLLLNGLDFNTLGAAEWQRRVALVPQFHENHVLSGTLAFNVLMGRAWPASDADLALAHDILRDLELGPLLDRMPNGLHQVIGETGWQLSHGERSRVYLARALLQGAELLILDESFAALDPETLEACWRVLFARQHTIVVIAHP